MNERTRQRIPGETQDRPLRAPDVPVRNTGRTTRHIPGTGITILPGETRLVPAHLLPPGASAPAPVVPAPAPEDPHAVVSGWLGQSIAQLRKLIPALSIDDIDALEAGELAAANPRKGLLNALQEARLQRAADAELEAFRAAIGTMDREELLTHAELVADDPARRAMIEAELNQRPADPDDGKPGAE